MPNDQSPEKSDWLEEYEGQLAIDVYQTDDSVVMKAPIAGVRPEDLEISITEDVVTIKGERKAESEISQDQYFAQECYWGVFSRSYILPLPVDADKATAKLTAGILTITLPKLEKTKTKVLKVKGDAE